MEICQSKFSAWNKRYFFFSRAVWSGTCCHEKSLIDINFQHDYNFQYFEKSYKDKVALEASEKFEKLQSLLKTNQSKHIIPISMGSIR